MQDKTDYANHLQFESAPSIMSNYIDKSGYKRHDVELREQNRSKAVQTVHSLRGLSQIYKICYNEVWNSTEGKRRTIIGVSYDPRRMIVSLTRTPPPTGMILRFKLWLIKCMSSSFNSGPLDRAGELAIRQREWVLKTL